MIREMKPLSLAEASKIISSASEDDGKEIKSFIKKFSKASAKEAEEIRKELEALDMIKLKADHIVKVIDFLPEDASDVNKIFSDVSLDENETNKILDIVKKYK